MPQLIILAILIGYTSVIMLDLLGQSRVFYSLAKDGLLPKVYSDIHPRYRTPWKSNMILCGFISLFAALVPIRVAGEMTSIGTLLAFVIVCADVSILRKTNSDTPRAFKTPLVLLVPILGILVCLGIMVFYPVKPGYAYLCGWCSALLFTCSMTVKTALSGSSVHEENKAINRK